MKASTVMLLSVFIPLAALALPPESSINARMEGIAPNSMTGTVLFSSKKTFGAFEVYLNTGSGGAPTKVCRQANPTPDKEYQCAISATAAPDVNAVNVYVVGVPLEAGVQPDQKVLAISNPAYSVSKAPVGASPDKSSRLEMKVTTPTRTQ